MSKFIICVIALACIPLVASVSEAAPLTAAATASITTAHGVQSMGVTVSGLTWRRGHEVNIKVFHNGIQVLNLYTEVVGGPNDNGANVSGPTESPVPNGATVTVTITEVSSQSSMSFPNVLLN